MEKRHFARFSLDADATLSCGARRFDTRLVDISLKGALVNRPHDFDRDVGQGCALEIRLPESDVMIVMQGTVAHTEGSVVGFRCDQIGLDSISHLKRLVQLNLGDEHQLERELGELVAPHA